MKIKFALCAALAAIVCSCVSAVACSMFEKKKAEMPVDFTIAEVTDTTIIIDSISYGDGEEYNTYGAEFSVDGENWIVGGELTGLISNTEYTVYGRNCGWGSTLPSDPITKKVTTLRSVNSNLPEVNYAQERGKITINGFTEGMEVSFDNGQTYSKVSEHTYTQKGVYEISVRYAESDRCFASEAVTFNVEYSDFLGGLGTEEKPYLVTSYDELRLLNSDRKYYKLLNDITFPAEERLPIAFSGNLDGNGKKLISPRIKNAESGTDLNAAIFSGTVSVKDLTVENAVITSSASGIATVGILTSYADEIVNCRVNGEININATSGYFGGIAGYMSNGKIENCDVEVSFKYVGDSLESRIELSVGGVVGYSPNSYRNEILNCKADMSLSMTGSSASTVHAGGISGNKGGALISGCSAQTDITAYASNLYLGGIAGGADDLGERDKSAIVNCFASGEIVAQNLLGETYNGDCYVGGILGTGRGGYSSTCDIRSCVSAVNISVDGTKLNVSAGGIIGKAYAYSGERVIEGCLYTGNIAVNKNSSLYNYIGAVYGSKSEKYEIENCFIKTQPSPDVDCAQSGATVVEEEVYLTASWQRENLKLDETVWTVAEGKLPELK
ncbi:MAG: hypothetical protein K2N33_04515 [Clostridia bacterium]|nr:hypothetical protein [Clostridia bacterium]